MSEFANSNTDALEEVRKRRLLIDRCDAYLFEQIQPFLGNRVLEVGSGHGNLVSYLMNRDLVMATDIDGSSVETLRKRFGHCPNIQAQQYDITEPRSLELSQLKFDTIVCLNALEHIQDDQAALANMARILAPGGRAVIIVPAFQYLYGTMDSSIGHFRRYTKSLLGQRLERAGLNVEKQRYFNLLGIVGWFVNGRIFRQTVPPSAQLRLYNVVFPFASKLESLLPGIIGLSLISISRRG